MAAEASTLLKRCHPAFQELLRSRPSLLGPTSLLFTHKTVIRAPLRFEGPWRRPLNETSPATRHDVLIKLTPLTGPPPSAWGNLPLGLMVGIDKRVAHATPLVRSRGASDILIEGFLPTAAQDAILGFDGIRKEKVGFKSLGQCIRAQQTTQSAESLDPLQGFAGMENGHLFLKLQFEEEVLTASLDATRARSFRHLLAIVQQLNFGSLSHDRGESEEQQYLS